MRGARDGKADNEALAQGMDRERTEWREWGSGYERKRDVDETVRKRVKKDGREGAWAWKGKANSGLETGGNVDGG